MFKSQSKNSLADDDDLSKEIKFCCEAIGRRLKTYINRRQALRKSEKRGNWIILIILMSILGAVIAIVVVIWRRRRF